MTDQIVGLETAQLAKEKGFDWPTRVYHSRLEGLSFSLPTQALLQKWLREKHNIHIQPQKHFHNKGYKIGKIPIGESSYNGPHSKKYNTYEEALEIGLKYALTLIK